MGKKKARIYGDVAGMDFGKIRKKVSNWACNFLNTWYNTYMRNKIRINHKRIIKLVNYTTKLVATEIEVPGHRFMSVGTFNGEEKWFIGSFSPSGMLNTFNIGSERYIKKVWKNFQNSSCIRVK